MTLSAAMPGAPEVVLGLLREPAFGVGPKGQGRTQGHFGADPGAPVEHAGQGLAAHPEGRGRLHDAEAKRLKAERAQDRAGDVEGHASTWRRLTSFFIEDPRNRGLDLISLHESFDTSTAIGRAMLEIILVLNQLEREQISEATKQRLQAARAAGKRLGRPALSAYKRRRIAKLGAGGLSPWKIHQETGYSVAACYKYNGLSGG